MVFFSDENFAYFFASVRILKMRDFLWQKKRTV